MGDNIGLASSLDTTAHTEPSATTSATTTTTTTTKPITMTITTKPTRTTMTMSCLEFIKSRVQQKKKPADIYTELVSVYGQSYVPTRASVFIWAQRFASQLLQSAQNKTTQQQPSTPSVMPTTGLSKDDVFRSSRELLKLRLTSGARIIHIHREIQRMYGSNAPSYSAVKKWSRKFHASNGGIFKNIENGANLSLPMTSSAVSYPGASQSGALNIRIENGNTNSQETREEEEYDEDEDDTGLDEIMNPQEEETEQNDNNNNNMSGGEFDDQLRTCERVASSESLHDQLLNADSKHHFVVSSLHGFDRGLEPERICECVKLNGVRLFVIKWQNLTQKDLGNFFFLYFYLFVLLIKSN